MRNIHMTFLDELMEILLHSCYSELPLYRSGPDMPEVQVVSRNMIRGIQGAELSTIQSALWGIWSHWGCDQTLGQSVDFLQGFVGCCRPTLMATDQLFESTNIWSADHAADAPSIQILSTISFYTLLNGHPSKWPAQKWRNLLHRRGINHFPQQPCTNQSLTGFLGMYQATQMICYLHTSQSNVYINENSALLLISEKYFLITVHLALLSFKDMPSVNPGVITESSVQ